jgi:DNA-binding CsgD family transcriptional regulator
MEAGAASRALVGREHELARIRRFLERAGTDPASLVLEGEPGIGKTALWRAGVEAAVERDRLLLVARPVEAERELSFSGLGDLLEPALGRLEALAAPRRHALEVALLLVSDEDRAPDPRAVGLATLDLLRLLARDGGLIVAIDDAQWLDPPSRGALEYALRRLEGEPIGLLTASRPGAGGLTLGEPERVVVAPLSLRGLHELLGGRVSGTISRPTLARVHETSGGNPFFALELARALDGREARPGEPLPVPESLSDLTATRFARLEPQAREVLLYVAALGHPTREIVGAAAGEHATASALDAAEAEGLMEADGSRLRFVHPLLASVHYGSAAPDDRVRIHRRLAEVVTDAEERGRHLGAAATAPDAPAAAALDEAAAAAQARGAPSAAAELAEVAVRLTPRADSAGRLRRLCDAADHRFAAGSAARARTLLERALADAPRGRERAKVALQLAAQLDVQDVETERLLLARALLEAEGDPMLRASAHFGLADHHFLMDVGEAGRQAHVAVELAERAGDPRLIAETLSAACMADAHTGAAVDHALLARGIALEERLPRIALLRRPSTSYASALEWSGEVDRARPLWERLRARGRSEGDLDLMHILFFSVFHELHAEDWEQAARYADEARALAVDAERQVAVAVYLWLRVLVAAFRGEVDLARSLADEARHIAAETGWEAVRFSGPARGILELSVGDAPAALAHLRPATERRLATGETEPSFLLGFPDHVEAAVACSELDEASGLLDFVEQHARRLDRAWALGCCARGRALLSATRGDERGAEAAFARAYEQHARRPQQLATYELARTSLAHGSILRRRQQKRRAREALGRAVEIFEGLGSAVYVERARSELARIGGRAAAAGDELSETERRIADLVAEGRSNKQVAAALSLSPKTVEWNLSKVYAKLGVHSRTELARRLP